MVLVAAAVLVAVVAASQNGRELQTPPVCVACLLWVTTLPMAFSYDVVDSHHTHAQVQRAWTTLSALGRRVIEVDDDDLRRPLSRSLRRPLKGPLTARVVFSDDVAPDTLPLAGWARYHLFGMAFLPTVLLWGSPLPLCSHAVSALALGSLLVVAGERVLAFTWEALVTLLSFCMIAASEDHQRCTCPGWSPCR